MAGEASSRRRVLGGRCRELRPRGGLASGARCHDDKFDSIYIYMVAVTLNTTDKEFQKVTYASVRKSGAQQQDSAYFYTLYDRYL